MVSPSNVAEFIVMQLTTDCEEIQTILHMLELWSGNTILYRNALYSTIVGNIKDDEALQKKTWIKRIKSIETVVKMIEIGINYPRFEQSVISILVNGANLIDE